MPAYSKVTPDLVPAQSARNRRKRVCANALLAAAAALTADFNLFIL